MNEYVKDGGKELSIQMHYTVIDLCHNDIPFEATDAILCTARNLHHTYYVENTNT